LTIYLLGDILRGTKQQGADMKEEIIMLTSFVALAFGAYKYATEPDFEKKCETYMRGDYNKNTKTCEIIIEQPTEEPEKHLNNVLKKLLGGKANCTLNSSEILDPKKHPFRQTVSAVCNKMKFDITFTESLNDYSKTLIQRAKNFNIKCQLFDKTKSCLIPVSNTYRYDYYEFGTPYRKNLIGYKELAHRNAETPMVCRTPIHDRVKQPTKEILKQFSNCNLIGAETPDENVPSKQNVVAICDEINVVFEFDNVINSKQR
jgi:hypothetical protein